MLFIFGYEVHRMLQLLRKKLSNSHDTILGLINDLVSNLDDTFGSLSGSSFTRNLNINSIILRIEFFKELSIFEFSNRFQEDSGHDEEKNNVS